VITAILLTDELQATILLMSCAVPSEKLPVAVNCCCVPTSMVGFAGVTTMEVIVALVTVSVAVPTMFPEVALTVVVPAPTALARPEVPAVLLIVATAPADELQLTCEVKLFVLWSLKVPMAVN
jgi:hypothetical protein